MMSCSSRYRCKRRLHAAGDSVVPIADVLRIENAAGRGQRIDGRVDTLFRDRTFQIDERVELAERRRRGGVGRVVGRHVDRLHRGDGPLVGRGDSLLQRTHFRGQRRLVTHGRRHPAQQRGHFASGLREAEDVVDEQQRVGTGRVAEVFGHGQRREGHAQTGTRRLVHLAEDHAGLLDHAAAGVADLGLLHFEPEVGSFAGPLADAGEHRVAAVCGGDPGDQLGENDRLAQTGTAEQTGLATADERRQQVDHLDAGLEELGLGRQVGQGRAHRGGSANARRRRPARGRRPARRAG